MLALLSFRKLQKEYPDYKGGLLLIDEADAGLFPAAQIKLIEILQRECKKLRLQVVMTSHSPTLIEDVFEKSKKFPEQFKTIYLSDTYGSIQVMHDKSWPEIEADLNTKTIKVKDGISLPRINIYFEDKEGIDLFKAVMRRHPAMKFLKLLDVSLGCENYITLVKRKVPEFSNRSIICLDADVEAEKTKNHPSIILLPGKLPPDKLIFEYLYNMPADHPIWKNPRQFNKPVFTNIARDLIRRLEITGDTEIDLISLVRKDKEKNNGKEKLRNLFKKFYRDQSFQEFLAQRKVEHNPWHCWIKNNQSQCDNFTSQFTSQLKTIMRNEHYVTQYKLDALNTKEAKPTMTKPSRT